MAASGWRRGAIVWVLAVGAVLGAMLPLKLVSMTCGHLVAGRELHSPSGHTAASAAIYGGLGALLACLPRRYAWRWWLLAPVAVALVIGATRIALGVHTVMDVALGGSVGVVGALAAAALAGSPPPGFRLGPIAAVVTATAQAFHGIHLPAEAAIGRAPLLRIWPLSACAASQLAANDAF